jgi:nitrite reductase (NADH) small subunit
MSDRIAVCGVGDLPPGERELVRTPRGSVGVFNVDGTLYALRNDCCHLDGPVCEGAIKRELEATYPGPGKRIQERVTETPTIACPWHGFEYRLESGEHLGDEDIVLETYEVAVEDGTIYLEL